MQMRIVRDNVWLTVEEPRPLARVVSDKLRRALAYRPDGYRHDWRYRAGQWDGWETLWDSGRQRCRVGNAWRVLRALEGTPYEIEDRTLRRGGTLDLEIDLGDKTPREYQVRAVEATRANPMGIISSPTGSGKTLILGMLIAEHKMRTLVVLNDVTLMGQTHDELTAMFGDRVGLIGDGEFDPRDITVATIQSLITILRSDRPRKVPQSKAEKKAKKKAEYRVRESPNRPALVEYLETVQMAVHDEVHLADSGGVNEFYPQLPRLERAYGLSATPYEFTADGVADGNILQEQHFGRVIFDSVHEGYDFIALGAKVPVVVQVQVVPAKRTKFADKMTSTRRGGRWRRIPDASANYAEALKEQILTNEAFHQQVADAVLRLTEQGLSNFVFAPHSLEYLESIRSRIPGAEAVTGKTSRRRRQEIFRALANKEILCVVSDIGSVGLNIPSLDVIHNCSDYVDIRQIEGRVARAAPGKSCGIFYDYAHVGVDFLDKHFETRMAQYKMLGNLVVGAPTRRSIF